MIKVLEEGSVFVFGSNQKGVHGRGAALIARYSFKYPMGKGEGIHLDLTTGRSSYGLPTKDHNIQTMSLRRIQEHILILRISVEEYSHLTWYITRVGCGLAGYSDKEIAPLFVGFPKNCVFDQKWSTYLPGYETHDGNLG